MVQCGKTRKGAASFFAIVVTALVFVGCGGGGGGDGTNPPEDQAFEIEGSIFVPGTIQGAAIAPSSDLAYVSTGAAIIELNLMALTATRSLFLSSENRPVVLSELDAAGEHALVFNFDGAAVVDLSDGSRSPSVGGGSSGPSVFANNKIYTPSFNGRGVVVASIDGSNSELILPFPAGTGVAGPSRAVATPDETRVIFDDEFNDAIHVIDTSIDEVIASASVGFDPLNVIAIDPTLAVVFVEGGFVTVDLTDPDAVPDFTELPLISGQVRIAPAGPDRRNVVVFDFHDPEEEPEWRLAIVDTVTGIVEADQTLDIDDTIMSLPSLAVSPDGSRIVLGIGPRAYVIRPSSSFR